MPPTDSYKRLGPTIICLSLLIAVFTGCFHQWKLSSDSLAAPQEVYLSPSFHPYPNPNILICNFQAPDYARSVGARAALFLYAQMQQIDPEVNIAVLGDTENIRPDQLYIYAKSNRYDLIVTGKVLYYLDGAISTASRVDEEIHIYGIWGGKLQPVGYVKAYETAPPVPQVDYFIYQRSAKPAPSAESLQKRNAVKFAGLLNDMLTAD